MAFQPRVKIQLDDFTKYLIIDYFFQFLEILLVKSVLSKLK